MMAHYETKSKDIYLDKDAFATKYNFFSNCMFRSWKSWSVYGQKRIRPDNSRIVSWMDIMILKYVLSIHSLMI